MARSEYRRCPPRRPLRPGVQAAIASEDNQHRHIATSNEGFVVGSPVRNAILRLIPGMNLRLHPCSVAPAKRHEKYGPNHPTRSGSSCNNATLRPGASGDGRGAAGSGRSRWRDPSTAAARPAGRSGGVSRPRSLPRTTTPSHRRVDDKGLIVGRPVRNAVLRLIRGMDLRLHPCSVAPAEGPEKCAPPRRVFMQQRRWSWLRDRGEDPLRVPCSRTASS